MCSLSSFSYRCDFTLSLSLSLLFLYLNCLYLYLYTYIFSCIASCPSLYSTVRHSLVSPKLFFLALVFILFYFVLIDLFVLWNFMAPEIKRTTPKKRETRDKSRIDCLIVHGWDTTLSQMGLWPIRQPHEPTKIRKVSTHA
ncbi:hypothetical protein CLU79DRAFT_742617 [Phycomyces nitens]|nr:hypothetical protein CLU79DRAFT_742617 [Phycomyces nitens]